MKEIKNNEIKWAVKNLAMEAACILEPDILEALQQAGRRERSGLAKNVIDLLLANARIAAADNIPACQDTGIGVVFVQLGQEVHIDGDLDEAIQTGIKEGYEEGYLRKSVCDPLTRKNTGTNVPAVMHVELVPGDAMKITVLPKGCGSENMSGLTMLPPSAGVEGIIRYVTETVIKAGSNPCPPVIVGVGIGGSFEKAALLAKRALLRPVGEASVREDVRELEQQIFGAINSVGSGALGLGGDNTALAVHIEVFPSHIASLPVAVNIQCHSHRHKEVVL